MQEKMIFAGQLDCYSNSEEIISKLCNVEVNAMQVYRVTDTYGSMLEGQEMEMRAGASDVLKVKEGECVYAMVDGAMVLTRKGWSECKLGRIFKSTDRMEQSEGRGWIKHSLFDGYLGGSEIFSNRFEQKLDCYEYLKEKLIFITDGAPWIKNWLRDAYPQATHVLDFYHAYEHLCGFAKEYFKEEGERNKWLEAQRALLLESGVEQVTANIELLKTRKKGIVEIKNKLLGYYRSNKDRMDYNNSSVIF